MKKLNLYKWSAILFFLVVPIAAICIDDYMVDNERTFVEIAFKWFIFSGIGLRLGTAGIKQIIHPQFTAKEIFKISENASFLVRELGFANLCFSILAILSLFINNFRVPAAITGGIYFGLAALLHIFKKKDSDNEVFAMISDIYIFAVLAILLIFNR